MSFRTWITLITAILLGLVIYFAWSEIRHAWDLLGKVDLWILALLVPVQFISYYAAGGMIFSYLRAKGNLKDTSHWQMARMALELNFVNHILPSGGAAGFSYLGWVLGRHGVRPGRATMAQIVRFTLSFFAFIVILVIAVLSLIISQQIDRTILVISGALTAGALGGTIFMVYIVGSKRRLTKFSVWLTRTSNAFMAFVTRGKRKNAVKFETIETFFEELHQDYLEIRHEKKILIRPFMWALVLNIADVALLYIAFYSLGYSVDPALMTVAFGISSIASIASVAPGGAGIYEAVMIAFLASAGVPADIAIAGTLLARVTLVLGTILFGYIFYQLTVLKYGKTPTKR